MKTLLTILTVGSLAGKYLDLSSEPPTPQPGSTVASSCPVRLLAAGFIFFLTEWRVFLEMEMT